MGHKVTAAVAALAAVGGMLLASPDAEALPPTQPLPRCQFEDGNRDGKPCLWVDPDTKTVWYVDSQNYST